MSDSSGQTVKVTQGYIDETWKYVNELESNLNDIQELCRNVMSVNIHLPYNLREEEYTMSSHTLAMRILEVIRNNTSKQTVRGENE